MLTFQELQEASLTEASTELEQVLVSICGGKTPKKKFSNVLKQAQKNGFETAEELGEAILNDAGISLNSSNPRMSENGSTDPDWEGDNNTSKTDIHLGKYDISLKSGSAALMSGGAKESRATFKAALEHAKTSFQGDLADIAKEIEDGFNKMIPSTLGQLPGGIIAQKQGTAFPHEKGGSLGQGKRKMAKVGKQAFKLLDKEVQKTDVTYDKPKTKDFKNRSGYRYYKDDSGKEYEYRGDYHLLKVDPGSFDKDQILKDADDLHAKMKKQVADLFNGSEEFKNAFVFEAMTGYKKFSPSPENIAKHFLVATFSGSGTLIGEIKKYDDAYVKKVAKQVKPDVRFKSGSQEKTLDGKKQKTGYKRFWSVLQLNYNHIKEQTEIMEREAEEMQKFLSEGLISEVAFFSWAKKKIKGIVNYIKKVFNAVKNFILEKVDNILEFLELTPVISFNNTVKW